MQDVQVLIIKLSSIILIAIIGYFIASKNVLKDNGKDVISLVLNRVALPFMIFSAYVGIKLNMDTLINALYVIFAALVIYCANYIYSRIKAQHYAMNIKERSVFISGGVHSNTAFLAFPLLYAVYGSEGLFYATMYYMVDNVLLTTFGINRLMNENKDEKKLAPVTISLIISLPLMILLNALDLDITQTFFYQAASDLGAMTTPLAFLFIGMIVYQSNIKELMMSKPAINLIIVKTTIIPLAFILLFKLLDLDIENLIIIVVMTQAIMPPFSALLSMAYEYKQDIKIATSLVVMGHIYAMINIPLIFALLVLLFN